MQYDVIIYMTLRLVNVSSDDEIHPDFFFLIFRRPPPSHVMTYRELKLQQFASVQYDGIIYMTLRLVNVSSDDQIQPELSRIVRKPDFCLGENKGADQLCGYTAKLISAFVFATRIVQFLFYLNPKFQASSSFLSLYRPVCVGPVRKPQRPVFSRRGSIISCFQTTPPSHVMTYRELKFQQFASILLQYLDATRFPCKRLIRFSQNYFFIFRRPHHLML